MARRVKESGPDSDAVAFMALGLTVLGVTAFGVSRGWFYLTGSGLPQGIEFTWNCAAPAVIWSTLVFAGVYLLVGLGN